MKNEILNSIEEFEICSDRGRIVLRGDLDDSPSVLVKCRGALEKIPKFSHFTIEADDVRVVPEGVTIWIEAVKQFLIGCQLCYAPSQLALILQYDERYQHPNSTFQEHGVPAARV